ncbi:hypothetical protein AB0L13_39065 [Saccharopolyspora shandongensis]|uniref:hypothetical protein n=1 Tax=Saccharopolyspora shandongensis TaxID=418495 RepID=UPI003437113F
MRELVSMIRPHLPLRIDRVDVTEDNLNISGDGWALNVTCPWRMMTDDGLWFSWSDVEAPNLFTSLIGRELQDVRLIDNGPDPAFKISGNAELQVFGDTDYDPWVISAADTIVVGLVSPPGFQ